MALDDVLGDTSGTSDLVDSMMRQYQQDNSAPFTTDPYTLNNRLARKLMQPDQQPAPAAPVAAPVATPAASDDSEDDDAAPAAAARPAAQPGAQPQDLSSFGEKQSDPQDLSSFGEAPDVPDAPPLGLTGNIVAAGKGLLRGAPEAAGDILKGSSIKDNPPLAPGAMDLVDQLGTSASLTPAQRAKLQGTAIRTIGDRGLATDYNAALQRIASGSDAATEMEGVRAKFKEYADQPSTPVQERKLYKGGQQLKDSIDAAVPMTDQEKASIGGLVGTGIGGVAPYVAAGVVAGPEAGLALGAAGMGASSAGSTFEAAKAKGASDDVAAQAAGWSAGIGAALGVIPLGAVFKPVSQVGVGMKSWMAAKLAQAGTSGLTFAGVGEAQDYLTQEVAKNFYDPKAGYTPDAKRVISSFLTGGALGSAHPLSNSSPDEIAAFIKQANDSNPDAGTDTGPATGTARGAAWRKEIDDFLAQRAAQEAATAPALPKPDDGAAPSAPQSPEPSPNEPPGGAPTEQTEVEGLKRYGWTDDEIASMSPAQRRREFQDAMSTGESDAPAATGKRDDPIVAKTVDDVVAAQPVEPKSGEQANAENYQHAHIEMPALGLEGSHSVSIETGVGQTRKGTDESGKPWEVKMPVAYGRIKGTKGADGQPLDIAIGPHPDSPHVFIIDQKDPTTGKFDEHKIMSGFLHPEPAVRAYRDMHNDDAGARIQNTTAITADQFKDWIKNGDFTKPFKPHLSDDEIGSAFDDIIGGGETSKALTSFTTAKGSTYQIHDDGTTTRNKSFHPEHGAQDQGPQPRSAQTLYIAPSEVNRLAPPSGTWAIVKHDDGTLSMASQNEQGKWGVAPSAKKVPVSSTPSVGSHPIELWKKQTIQGHEAYTGVHFGNKITEISGGSKPASKPEPKAASKPIDGEVLPAAKVRSTEPTQEHHAQIEAVLGKDYDRVLPADIARAAEIMAEQEGITPAIAFGHAVIENAVAQKFLTHQQAVEAYGPEVKNILSPAADRTPESGEHGLEGGAKTEEAGTSDNAEDRVNQGGGETGEGGADANGGEGDEPDTERGDTNTSGPSVPEGGESEPVTEEPKATKKKGQTKPVVEPVTEPEAEKNNIQDAGEKIGRARKDAWIGKSLGLDDIKDMSEADKTKSVTKHNIWQRPDYVQAVEDGVDPMAAALIKRIYDRISVKPNPGRYSSDEPAVLRERFIEALTAVREVLGAAKTVDDVVAANNKISKALGNNSYSTLATINPIGSRKSPLYISGADKRVAEKAVTEGFPQAEPWTRLFEVSESHKWDDAKKTWAKDADNKPVMEWSVYRKTGGQAGQSGFATKAEAEVAAKKAYDSLSDERKKGGEEPKRPHLERINRDGPDYRDGKDVTGDDFVKDFGFRGVEFGNWAAQDERQAIVNFAYDGLHDLARILNIPAKAISLDGTLAVGFGSRGRGGKAAAHYESDYKVINMTKLTGAGSLAHEWAHALDDYLGGLNGGQRHGAIGITGWRDTPKDPDHHWSYGAFKRRNDRLPAKLRVATNKLMHDLFNVEEDDAAALSRAQTYLDHTKRNQAGWAKTAASIKDRMRKGGSSAGLKKAEDQVRIWDRSVRHAEEQLEEGITKKATPSNFLKQATILSGTTGDYWRRPNELFARSFESFVFDKIAEEGFTSQYLVQGVEETRYGSGYKGNPYPTGEERKTINSDYERLMRALATGEGKHGIGTRIEGAEGEPEPITISKPIARPKPNPSPVVEMQAVDEASQPKTLDAAFEEHFINGQTFEGIIAARKFAKDRGFDTDPKKVEEALEFAVVKAARRNIEASDNTKDAYRSLVGLYEAQPRLGTRTSTSVRDQAYSTPVPLAYVASELAGITHEKTVYEPTAGNGALLIGADPRNVKANEVNPDRQANLKAQGFKTHGYDASNKGQFAEPKSVDIVIANPPFGAVRQEGESKVFDMSAIQPGYETKEIDHAIALNALSAMKDDGSAVLILGGVNKQISTREGRSDAYNGKAKREFFKVLYDNYGVSDHFTVSGDLYERQGAAWPVDVIVIHGRQKSERALPAANVPRIYNSWSDLGGLLDAIRSDSGNAISARRPNDGPVEGGAGLAGGSPASGDDVGGRELLGQPEQGQPGAVQQEPVSGKPPKLTGGAVGGEGQEPRGTRSKPGRSDKQPVTERPSSRLSDDEIGDIFDNLISEKPTSAVAKAAAINLTSAADKALSGLTELFGGGKTIGMGVNFDEATYAKAKPMFRDAADRFSAFKGDIKELMRRMIDHMRDAMNWTTEMLAEARPYFIQFIKDVQSGEVKLNEEPKAEPSDAKAPIAGKAIETENQVSYEPQSKVKGLDTLVPVNMKKPISDALASLEDRVGPIDSFVANELGYDADDLANYFGAEQVDALGLAIDNIKRGKGFIIGDQTGIGKGRVNAAIIRWAIKHDRIPIFTTMNPSLYADMYRDMKDIGMADGFFKDGEPRVLMTNAGENVPLEEGKGGAALQTGNVTDHNALLASLSSKAALRKKYDMVFTTYAQMQTLKGEDTVRRQFLSNIVSDAVMIFDESHNAGGDVNTRKAAGEPLSRSGFARDLVQRANGVFYSSATYAKRPDVMDLYSATDMAMAVDDIAELGEAISRGGVPMQQAVASMLSKAGQYIRRERSFAGIEYNTPLVPVDRENYDHISYGLSAIQDFSKIVASITNSIAEGMKGEGFTAGTNGSTGEGGASSTNFTSIMHNVINQMLLAMKVGPAAEAAIETIKRGEKPVITVANTMESFLKEYADTLELKKGDPISGDFADVLQRYLEKTRTISITKPFAKKGENEKKYLTDEELGPVGRAAYAHAKATIAKMDLSDLPLSPIDHLKAQLQKAGYSVGEITGRALTIDYSGDKPVLSSRPGVDTTTKGKNATLGLFNKKPRNGGHHALILNQSGSTGISAHASSKFDDQSPRHMIIAQPEANIDTHMQLLGRINRTGQVVLPKYSQLVADIPAEKRPAAVLAKKMASLNANTTASRSSAVTAKDVPDFINEYGDAVAVAYLADNLELNQRLALPVKMNDNGVFAKEDAMRKLTGRIPLLPLLLQEETYQGLEGGYAELMQQLEAAGENTLEAKTLDLKAKTLETTEVQGRKNDSGSPFAAAVNMEKVSVARLGKPMTPHDVMNRISTRLRGNELPADMDIGTLANMLGDLDTPYKDSWGKTSNDMEREERAARLKEFDQYTRPILDDLETGAKQKAQLDKFNAIKDRWSNMHALIPIGRRVTLRTSSGNLSGIVIDVSKKGDTKNPLALGSWKATFAINDATRQMILPFSRMFAEGKSDSESSLDIEIVPMQAWQEKPQDTLGRFQSGQSESREERLIATGNLLAAYDYLGHKGSIINYTDAKGATRQGILAPKGFDLAKHAIAKGRIVSNPAEIKAYLDNNPGATIWSKDGVVSLRRAGRWSEDYTIQTDKSKRTGGIYFLDDKLTALAGDFYSRGGKMTNDIPIAKLIPAIQRLQELKAVFTVSGEPPKPTKVQDDEGEMAKAGAEGLTPAAVDHREAITSMLNGIVKHMVGDAVRTEFVDGIIPMSASAAAKYGNIPNAGASGIYNRAKALIKLALIGGADEMSRTAFHEAYHAIEFQLQTPQERALMERETPRIAKHIEAKGIQDVDQLAPSEVRAIGAELYIADRVADRAAAQAGEGMHIGVRRWYEKLWQAMRKIANGLRGLGFKTYEDIYNDAIDGKFAKRAAAQGGADDEHASIFRQKQNAAVQTRIRDLLGQATTYDKAKERFVDFNEGIKRLQDAVEARAGGMLADSQAFHTKKRLFPGKVAAETQDFNKGYLDPLVDLLKRNDMSLDDVGDLLYAQHAPERNSAMDKIDPSLNGEGSGMPDHEAGVISRRYATRGPFVDEINHQVDRIRDYIHDLMVSSGLESRATVDAWKDKYQHYVPLGGFEEPRDDIEDSFRETGKFNVRGKEVKKAFGRKSKADNPLVNLLDQAYRTIDRAKRNEYLRSLKLALSGLNPDDLKGFVRFDKGSPKKTIDPRTGLVHIVNDNSYRSSPNAVAYKVGGNTHYMVFDNRDTAEAIKRMHSDQLTGWLQSLLAFQNKIKASWTHYSPEFLPRHFLFRYPIEGAVNSLEQGNTGKYIAESAPFMGHASKAIFATNAGRIHSNPEIAQMQRYWEEMRHAGGSMVFRQMRDINLTREHLRNQLDALKNTTLSNAKARWHAGVAAMDTVTNALDNSLRLAAYANARRQGKSPEQAALIARDATVDFQIAGKWKNAMGIFAPFSGVSIATGARMVGAVARSHVMRRAFYGSIMAGFLSGMFNYLVGGDDKDGLPFAGKLAWWEKSLAFTVLNPFDRDAKGRPIPIHIPMPYNWAFPMMIGQAAASVMFSKDKIEDSRAHAMMAVLKSGLEALTPFGGEENMAANLTPELLRPFVHTMTNENTFGIPVHKDPAFQKGPRSQSGRDSTGEGWKYIAGALNTLSGGNRNKAGVFDLYPEDLREVLDYYSGTDTAQRLGRNAASTLQNAIDGKSPDSSRIPFAHIVRGADYDAANRSRNFDLDRAERRPWER